MRKRAKRKKKSNGTEAARTYILKHVMATGPKRVKWKTLVEREAKGDESNNDDKEDDENSSEESSSDSSSSDEYKSEVNMGMDNSYDANAYGEFFDPHETAPKRRKKKTKTKKKKDNFESDSDNSYVE